MDRSRPATPQQNYSRPTTPNLMPPGGPPDTSTPPSESRHKKKHSWFGSSKQDKDDERGPPAWIVGHPQKLAYDVASLVNARAMPELWDDVDGNCYIYLFPCESGRGASFKIDSAIFASSPVLTKLAFGDIYNSPSHQSGADRRQMPLDARTHSLSLNDHSTPPVTPPQARRNPGTTDTMSSTSSRDSRGQLSTLSSESATETHLYLPIKLQTNGNIPSTTTISPSSQSDKDPAQQDLQTLIDIRNLFAFLCGQSLVATARKSTLFHIFMTTAAILRSYEFSNLDGSTYGEVASSSFDSYVSELGLQDVRTSREKTVEGIVLGERMKSVFLYNEAFTHAAGKHEELVKMNSPKFTLISSVTQNRLIRAAMDLDKRTASIRLILNDFEFPALFTGIMTSRTSEERKEGVRFDAWKDAFLGFRKNLLGLYKARYGAWPPKASSKKNELETSGLNRLVVQDMYRDMSMLYDLLVDRTSLTSRTVDGVSPEAKQREEPTVRALRAVLSEYDRSSPPVKPPVPFDLPKLPSLKSTRPDFGKDKARDIKAIQKKIKHDEMQLILRKSYNEDALLQPRRGPQPQDIDKKHVPSRPTFVEFFMEMEAKAAHGCTIAEIVDLRIGQWIFMYVVLQALPMLACDAPSLKFTKGVEYFLCEPPRSGVPWANPNATAGGGAGGRTWFSVGDGGGVVSLPSDLVEHGVEGIYRRSHCWTQAERWTMQNPIMNSALHEQEAMNKSSLDGRLVNADDGYDLPQPPSTNSLLAPISRDGSRPGSRNSNRNSSIALGLEALPLPVGVTPDGPVSSGYGYPSGSRPGTPGKERPGSAPVHAVDSNKTFDAILGTLDQGKKKGRR